LWHDAENIVDTVREPLLILRRLAGAQGKFLLLSNVCKNIIERHGGPITAPSRPGLGSTFSVDISDKEMVQ
jgi:light-regulated signal transduction histidine kinase (bacteriophytochrome)